MLSLLVLLLACDPEPPPKVTSSPSPPSALIAVRDGTVDELAAATSPVICDVDPAADYRGGHIPGALHCPLDELDPRRPPLDRVPKGPIWVVSADDGRAREGARALAAAGYEAIVLVGGTNAWKAAGRPLE